MAVKPISPSERARREGITNIPDEMIKAVNGLLAAHKGKKKVVLLQKDIAQAFADKWIASRREATSANDETVARLWNLAAEKHWFDFEPLYEGRGWKVHYDKPARWAGESYDARFVFVVKS